MKTHLLSLAGIIVVTANFLLPQSSLAQTAKHEFPPLPYAYNALEPYIDAATMEIHYSRHHKGYYDRFIKAIAGTELENQTIEAIFAQISKQSTGIRNDGGGYYNHVVFWENLSPASGTPSATLLKAIDARFGSLDAFKEQFNKAALSVFGSGWAWLIITDDGQLEIVTSQNQDNPLMDIAPIKGKPLLTIDVWEHAYYLKYQNKRGEYVNAFWKMVNWPMVNQRFESQR
jgi:Fe-Mn family superoxide dismutase